MIAGAHSSSTMRKGGEGEILKSKFFTSQRFSPLIPEIRKITESSLACSSAQGKKKHTHKKHLELHGFTAAMHSQDQLPRIVLTSAGTILGNPGFPVNKTPHLYFRDSKTQTTCRKTRLPGGLPKRKKYEIKNKKSSTNVGFSSLKMTLIRTEFGCSKLLRLWYPGAFAASKAVEKEESTLMWGQSWSGFFSPPGETLKNQKTCVSSSANTARGKYINLSCLCNSLTETTPALLLPQAQGCPSSGGKSVGPPQNGLSTLKEC